MIISFGGAEVQNVTSHHLCFWHPDFHHFFPLFLVIFVAQSLLEVGCNVAKFLLCIVDRGITGVEVLNGCAKCHFSSLV
jgi:hypothetical protein